MQIERENKMQIKRAMKKQMKRERMIRDPFQKEILSLVRIFTNILNAYCISKKKVFKERKGKERKRKKGN